MNSLLFEEQIKENVLILICNTCKTRTEVHPPISAPDKCSTCGTTKNFQLVIELEERFEPHDILDVKVRDQKRRKIIQEQRIGDSLFKKTGRWHHLHRIIDRGSDYYKEQILDSQTGEVLRDCEEPLSKHQGHGSAKVKKP